MPRAACGFGFGNQHLSGQKFEKFLNKFGVISIKKKKKKKKVITVCEVKFEISRFENNGNRAS